MIIKVDGMHCMHCAATVEKALKGIGLDAKVNLEKGEAVATGTANADQIIAAVKQKGFKVTNIDAEAGEIGNIVS